MGLPSKAGAQTITPGCFNSKNICTMCTPQRQEQQLTAPMRPASNSFLGSFLSPGSLCLPSPVRGASLTLVPSWEPPFRKGFCLVAGDAAAEVVAGDSAMGADGKLGCVFTAHQSLSRLAVDACTQWRTLHEARLCRACVAHKQHLTTKLATISRHFTST